MRSRHGRPGCYAQSALRKRNCKSLTDTADLEWMLDDAHRPSDFHSRLGRKARVLGKRGRTAHRGRRFAILAAVLAVPAMAAPGEWRGMAMERPVTAQLALAETVEPMPFETPGGSFPGSAFFYLEDPPELAAELPSIDIPIPGAGDEAVQLVETRNSGPAARGFLSSGSGLDKARALKCLAQAVYYEAASESEGGQKAVAQVVLNRVSHPSYPNSICGVVYQGSQRRTGCQFSFTCDGSMARTPGSGAMARARRVAQDALSGEVYRPVGLATHYHTTWINPYWASSLDHIGTIGAHRFYRWRGNAGRKGAFTARYRGSEPVTSGRRTAAVTNAAPSANVDAGTAADPVALARAYEDARLKAVAENSGGTTPVTPAPEYAAPIAERGGDALFRADKMPQSGTVKPEYANSGRWIEDPKKPAE